MSGGSVPVCGLQGDSVCLTLFDDLMVGCSNEKQADSVCASFVEHFSVKSLGDARFILGMELDNNRDSGIMVLQKHQFIAKLLDRFGQCDANPVRNPLVIGQDLSPSDEHKTLDNKSRYRELIGALLYVAYATRPYICMSLSMLSQYLEEPRKLHWNAALTLFLSWLHLAGIWTLHQMMGMWHSSSYINTFIFPVLSTAATKQSTLQPKMGFSA
ncbi:hypothetical protein PsorP6_011384 [Peronosclerospora sorghi]|uniref:Uncharacterized protein n=1 Tax=Peronosclerospora sorghi TaxID=230839 RepID=A0ACC0WL65_9STRA|nr:hypothetical protein PsorP6_011384 [Peronosclerospora sorghi]